MTERMTEILKILREFPELNIAQIARLIKTTTLEVSQCQHEYLKQLRRK